MDSTLVRDMRVRDLKILSDEPHTPLLHNQMRHAITLFSIGTDGELDTLLDQIEEHWVKIYGDLASKARLVGQMALFHEFLIEILLSDYAKKPYTPTPWVSTQAELIRQHRAGNKRSHEDATYQLAIALPLEELMVNKEHVERKILSAATHERSRVQLLIDRCEWKSLAATVKEDRHTASSLFTGHPFYPRLFSATTRGTVLRGLDKIERTYLRPSLARHHLGRITQRISDMVARGGRGSSGSIKQGLKDDISSVTTERTAVLVD